jgi:hypothetical protein
MCKSVKISSSPILRDSTEQMPSTLSPVDRNRSSSRNVVFFRILDDRKVGGNNPVCYTLELMHERSSAARRVMNPEEGPGGPIVAHRSNNANFDWSNLECSYFKLQIVLGYGLVKQMYNFFRSTFRWSNEGWDGEACKTDLKKLSMDLIH